MKHKTFFPIINELLKKEIKKSSNANNYSSQKVQAAEKRQTRFDKLSPRKFPVTKEEERMLRTLYLLYKVELKANSITEFLTMMLRFGLRHPDILKNDFDYSDTKIYKTVKPNQVELEKVSGLNGWKIDWGVSERKALYHIIFSVYQYVQNGGRLGYEEVQPIRPNF